MKKIISLFLAIIVLACVFPHTVKEDEGAIVFYDLEANNTHIHNILYLYDKKLINGYTNGKFGVEDGLTRAQAVAIIYRYYQMRGDDPFTKRAFPQFTDVKSTHTHYAAIKWAAERSIVDGSNGKFNPGAHVTRMQMAKILKGAFFVPDAKTQHLFTDLQVSDTAYPYFNDIFDVGISKAVITGANEITTRSQYTSFLVRSIFFLDKGYGVDAPVKPLPAPLPVQTPTPTPKPTPTPAPAPTPTQPKLGAYNAKTYTTKGVTAPYGYSIADAKILSTQPQYLKNSNYHYRFDSTSGAYVIIVPGFNVEKTVMTFDFSGVNLYAIRIGSGQIYNVAEAFKFVGKVKFNSEKVGEELYALIKNNESYQNQIDDLRSTKIIAFKGYKIRLGGGYIQFH